MTSTLSTNMRRNLNKSPDAFQQAHIRVTYSFNCNVLQHNHKPINILVDLNTALYITDDDEKSGGKKQNEM